MTTKAEKKLIPILFIIFILLNILPIIIASAFSTYLGDDFAIFNEYGYTAFTEYPDFPTYFNECFNYMKHYYMNWQGSFFAFFILTLFSPLHYFKGQAYHWFMVFNAILLCTSFLYFMLVYWKHWARKISLPYWLPFFMAGCGIYMLVNYDIHHEIFFWFSCSVAYSVPVSFVFLALAFLLRFKQSRKLIFLLAACFFGFFAMGGTLAVSGMGCFLCLLFCVYEFFENRHIEKSSASLFASMLAGALINAAAPGNFARHSFLDDSGLHPLTAFKNSSAACWHRIQWLIEHTGFTYTGLLAILSLMVILGIFIGKKGRKVSKAYAAVSAAALFLPIVTGFPIALGYSNWIFPGRCLFLLDISFILSWSNAALLTGLLLADRLNSLAVQKASVLKILVCMLFIVCFKSSDPQNLISYRVFQELREGTYQNYHHQCQELFEYLKTQKGKDVVLTEEQYPVPIPLYYNFFIFRNNPEHIVSQRISQYFGLNSLTTNSPEATLYK